MYGKSTAGKDDDDNRKPSAKPLDSYRKGAQLPESKDGVVKDDTSSEEIESTPTRKRKIESDEAGDHTKEPRVEQGMDLTTVAGQLTLNPAMSEEDAREAAKKEYHRKHAAKSRIRHKGLLRDLTDKVAELRKSNQELREAHDQLISQLKVYEHVEPGLASQLLALQAKPLPDSESRGANAGSVDPHPDVGTQGSFAVPSLSELLPGGGQQLQSHQGFLQARSPFAGLQSYLQSQPLHSLNPFPTQADTLSSIQHMLHQARDGSSIASAAPPAVETDAMSRLISEALRGQSAFNPQSQLQAAALPMTIGNANLPLNQLAQLNDAQLALLGISQGNQLGGRQTALQNAVHPSTARGPQDEARRNQDLMELLLRYLASGRR